MRHLQLFITSILTLLSVQLSAQEKRSIASVPGAKKIANAYS
jgi:hypothetical protein